MRNWKIKTTTNEKLINTFHNAICHIKIKIFLLCITYSQIEVGHHIIKFKLTKKPHDYYHSSIHT